MVRSTPIVPPARPLTDGSVAPSSCGDGERTIWKQSQLRATIPKPCAGSMILRWMPRLAAPQ